MRHWRLLAVLAIGVVIGTGAAGAAWYLSSDGGGDEAQPAASTEIYNGGWEARRQVGSDGILTVDEDSQCALAVNPSVERELIICYADSYYQCFEPSPDHARDDPDWWTERKWDESSTEAEECTNARQALWDVGLISFGA